MREAPGHSPLVAAGAAPLSLEPTVDHERILLLEIRLERLCSVLDDARADADRQRENLAQAAAREADDARRYAFVHQELAEARAEIASLHERLHRSEALRAELEGQLFEAGSGDATELVRLRRELLTHRQRSLVSEQTATRLRARVDELLMSREKLLTRVAEWQQLIRKGDPGAVDLSEFIAELRRDILALENRNAASDRHEAALRGQLARAGVDPDVVPESSLAPASSAAPGGDEPNRAQAPESGPPVTVAEPDAISFESFLLSAVASARLVDPFKAADSITAAALEPAAEQATAAVEATSPNQPARVPADGLSAADPAVRAAVYERLIRGLADNPSELVNHLRSGLADADPRVRRMAVLATATARNVSVRPLLDPLRGDPDPQVRRVVLEVLRHAPRAEPQRHDSRENSVGLAPGSS